MKWIVSVLIFATVVFLLKQTESPKSQNLIVETQPVISFKCEDVWRTSNMLDIGFNLKSGEYSFRTQLQKSDCEQFNKKVKIGSIANVSYQSAGYKRFSLVSIEIDNQVWVKQ
ncbi:hypothetical protein KZZ04_08565 [Pseudoalteromonas sp. CR1]|uniref:hypothetical protein n=1 Tax=Pseudoalteromonas sp. CR1 TaxID=2861964 RepID=UPI001C5F9816|nr:hypothetical protein [Pseudoalteromonas sp. CR1]MBW4966421.1 hypothetical protein [Pseudoalteromonas sp. CR1]